MFFIFKTTFLDLPNLTHLYIVIKYVYIPYCCPQLFVINICSCRSFLSLSLPPFQQTKRQEEKLWLVCFPELSARGDGVSTAVLHRLTYPTRLLSRQQQDRSGLGDHHSLSTLPITTKPMSPSR